MSTPAVAAPPPRLAVAAACAVAALVVILGAMRLHYGVDFTDEAYYAAIPYRFVLGDAPYTSELNVRQNAGLLLSPLVRLWVWIRGDSDGLMLFLRYVDLLTRVALTALAVRVLSRHVRLPLALVASSILCAFVFFSLSALSYNTLAAGAVTAGLLFLLQWTDTGSTASAAAAMSLALVSAFVHPALLPVGVAVCAAVLWLAPDASRRRRAARIAALLATVAAACLIGLVVHLGRENVERLLNVGVTYAGPTPRPERLLQQTQKTLAFANGGLLLAALWCALWGIHRLPVRWAAVLLIAYFAIVAPHRGEEIVAWPAVASIPLAYRQWRASGDRRLLVVALLSLAAGTSVALFSTNGLWNVALGAGVAVLVTLIASAQVLARASRGNEDARIAAFLPSGLAALTALALVVSHWDYVFRDDPVPSLTASVPEGPYRWLRTTPDKLRYLLSVQTALRSHSDGKHSLLAFYGLPAAHLLVPIRPALATTWVANYDEEYMRKMRRDLATLVPRASRPVLVLQVFRIRTSSEDWREWAYPPDDPLMRAVLAEHPRLLARNRDFALYEIPPD